MPSPGGLRSHRAAGLAGCRRRGLAERAWRHSAVHSAFLPARRKGRGVAVLLFLGERHDQDPSVSTIYYRLLS